ncbi:carbonic anhydrase [Halothermothrix orenii]|uniref:Carbonic anhydrase n=1 Tax=Halothermothrix orenii (strain H 168 / OCM 544 / DSM 9562) TaxID=373903 RepID=B8CXX3_HALOH|nr:carbonic anhydrase [Halothermothrix orenii]ACL70142.1 Carbonate dehydratase [Halothermothrix orenii H 168]
MDKLFKGVKKFSKHEYKNYKTLYKNLSNKQSPHTLFITCSDSRVVPGLITDTLPGELFIIRNVANIVPPYSQAFDFVSTTSGIEYAVNVLQVKNIVICGHSNCGGCKALFMDEKINDTPYTQKWVQLVEPLKEKVLKLKYDFNYERDYQLVEQENIILQMKNLLTYPYIKNKYQNAGLKIYGWYYDIGNGIVYNYNKSKC